MKQHLKLATAAFGLVGFLASCGATNPNLGSTPKISGKVNGYSGLEKVIKVFL